MASIRGSVMVHWTIEVPDEALNDAALADDMIEVIVKNGIPADDVFLLALGDSQFSSFRKLRVKMEVGEPEIESVNGEPYGD